VSPDFRELIGDDIAPEERERLLRAHDLLVAAGPPPELPASLLEPPRPRRWTLPMSRRRWTLVPLTAALLAAAFGAGYLTRDSGFEATREVAMRGSTLAPAASATIRLGQRDAGGNWPMILEVRGLKQLPPRGYYELLLTRAGKPIAPCGSFDVERGATEVYLNAPYNLRRFDGWVVVMHERGHVENPPIVMRTVASA
jgi:hypothetical protein